MTTNTNEVTDCRRALQAPSLLTRTHAHACACVRKARSATCRTSRTIHAKYKLKTPGLADTPERSSGRFGPTEVGWDVDVAAQTDAGVPLVGVACAAPYLGQAHRGVQWCALQPEDQQVYYVCCVILRVASKGDVVCV